MYKKSWFPWGSWTVYRECYWFSALKSEAYIGCLYPGNKMKISLTENRNSIWMKMQHGCVFLLSSDQKFHQEHPPVCNGCWSLLFFSCISPSISVQGHLHHRIRCASCTIPKEWPERTNYVIYRRKTWIWAKHLTGPEFLSSWCHPVTKVWNLKSICFHGCGCYWMRIMLNFLLSEECWENVRRTGKDGRSLGFIYGTKCALLNWNFRSDAHIQSRGVQS